MFSSSRFGTINYKDILNALRSGVVALLSAFIAGATGVAPAVLQNGELDIKAMITMITIAGLTSCVDLIRRFLTDYSSQKDRIVVEG